MEDKKINEKESLELITKMISNTQRRLEKTHAVPFLIFGYLTVVVSIAVWYLLKTTANTQWNFLWLAIPVVGLTALFGFFYKNRPTVRTFVDRTVDYVWYVCGGIVTVAGVVPDFWKSVPILFLVTFVISIGVTLTGLITKVRLLAVSGGIGIASAIALSYFKGLNSILIFAAIFAVIMVIPGHILYYKGKK